MNGKKVTKNLIIGILSQTVTIILGVFVPRLILTSYGSEVNGLLSSVTQIYSYIALVEAGIGTATVQALYKSVGNGDKDKTNSVLAATNRYYKRTGLVYLAAIVLFASVYPFVVNSDIPKKTIVLVIFFNGIGSVINYFFQAKYLLLLQAEGKNYIHTTLNMIINVLKNIAKIVFMSLGFSVVFVQASAMIVSLIQMVGITWYIKKNYTWIDLKVKPDYKSISQSKNVLVHQISGLIFNNTDALVLTFFCGLKTVSIYSMYTLIFGMIGTALNTVSSSITFVLGQSFHTDKKRFVNLLDTFEVYYMALVFALYSIANFFILPFMKLYTSGVEDINYIDEKLPLLFIATYLLSCGRITSNSVINIAGHFKLTQNRSIFESVINLVVSLIAVQFYGIYGVLIGTIAALLYRTNDMIWYANRRILHRNPWIVYRRWLLNLAIFIAILFVNKFLNFEIDSYVKVFAYCVPYTLSVLAVYGIIVSVAERDSAKFVINIFKDKLLKR